MPEIARSTTSVEVRDITKRFGPVLALDGVSMSINTGEIVSLLGPSGCGKTTLMRLIAGFEAPTSGTIEIDGVGMADTPPEKRPVNMVFQHYALFPHLDVFENVAFGLKMKRVPKSEIRTRVEELLSIVQLTDLATRRIGELSGGQSQRVALARALVNRPKVLLLDEPLAALDLKIRQQMLIEMKRIHVETGATFIYVTHDQDEAMILSDRIVLMAEGRIMQIDEPRQMYTRPRTLFAARFLGEINILRGTVVESGCRATTVELDGTGTVVVCAPHDTPAGDRVVVSLRPEAIRFRDPGVPHTQSLHGTVVDIAFVGARSFFQVALPSGVTVTVQAQDSDGSRLPHKDESVVLYWLREHAIVLADTEDGQASAATTHGRFLGS